MSNALNVFIYTSTSFIVYQYIWSNLILSKGRKTMHRKQQIDSKKFFKPGGLPDSH